MPNNEANNDANDALPNVSADALLDPVPVDDESPTQNQPANAKADNRSSTNANKSQAKSGKESRNLAEYLHKLREESKEYRLQAEENNRKAEEARKQANEALTEVKEKHKSYEQRIINAELKALAVKEGIINVDDLKLADLNSVKLTESGDVVGANELIESLKQNRPYLFSANPTSSTSTQVKTPPATTKAERKVANMPDAEYAKHKAQMLRDLAKR